MDSILRPWSSKYINKHLIGKNKTFFMIVKSIFLLDLNHMDSRSGIIIVMVRGPHDLKYIYLIYEKLWELLIVPITRS